MNCKEIAIRLRADIDAYMQDENAKEGFRSHLGASLIGRKCKREIWYGFRWVKQIVYPGRVLRLFERGHREEQPWIERLRAIGCTVYDTDPKSGKQIRVHGVLGHFGGSCDAVVQLPERYGVAAPVLWECKTNKANADFKNLENGKGVAIVKPEHWAQMCVYGKKLGLEHAAYFNTRKDDDETVIEVVKLCPKTADHMEAKAELIITSRTPPQRISDNPTNHNCKFCDYADICHYNEPVAANCRSCKHAEAIADGQWGCHHFGQIIPKEFLSQGCPQHWSVNDVC